MIKKRNQSKIYLYGTSEKYETMELHHAVF